MTEVAAGLADTPPPPYYAVVFTSIRTSKDDGYAEAADAMVRLAAAQRGFLGMESVRGADGVGITVSYWESLEAIAAWKRHADHMAAQEAGRQRWYDAYAIRVCRVERAYEFHR
jgi:heme-degrading monooxygenase HmoA